MNFLTKIKFGSKEEPEHLRRGRIGEQAAKQYLQRKGLKFLTANFRSERGEIDLIFRERAKKGVVSLFTENESDCLIRILLKIRHGIQLECVEGGEPRILTAPSVTRTTFTCVLSLMINLPQWGAVTAD